MGSDFNAQAEAIMHTVTFEMTGFRVRSTATRAKGSLPSLYKSGEESDSRQR